MALKDESRPNVKQILLRRERDREAAEQRARAGRHPALNQPDPFSQPPAPTPLQILRQIRGQAPSPSSEFSVPPNWRIPDLPPSLRSQKRRRGRGKFRNR